MRPAFMVLQLVAGVEGNVLPRLPPCCDHRQKLPRSTKGERPPTTNTIHQGQCWRSECALPCDKYKNRNRRIRELRNAISFMSNVSDDPNAKDGQRDRSNGKKFHDRHIAILNAMASTAYLPCGKPQKHGSGEGKRHSHADRFQRHQTPPDGHAL